MLLEHAKLIDQCNDNKYKSYYQLNDLEEITGLCIRMLKYRMCKVKKKYKDVNSLLFKEGKRWQIHYSIVDEFFPKKSQKQPTDYTYPWKSFGTWSMRDDYDLQYHSQLLEELKEEIGQGDILYGAEHDKRGVVHIHLVSTEDKDTLDHGINKVIGKYLNKAYYKTDVTAIINKFSTVYYLLKSPLLSGTLKN
jgi:hypothetical protein